MKKKKTEDQPLRGKPIREGVAAVTVVREDWSETNKLVQRARKAEHWLDGQTVRMRMKNG